MHRKEFIKTCGFFCVNGIALTAILESCASSNYFAKNTLAGNKITIKKGEFENADGKSAQRKYVLLKNEKFNFPICIYKISDDNYSALLMECSHKGCELQPHGEYLICPCHGSEFSNKGVAQNPPAEENLKSFNIITDDENIYVQL